MKILILLLFSISAFAADNRVHVPDRRIVNLIDNSSNLWPVEVIYTTDGNGNVIPIAGATGSSVTVVPNTAGSYAQSTVVGTAAVTFTKPANAVGFILMASSSNSVNLRFAVGATPTTTSGMRLEPGRDTGYIPVGADLKVVAESSSNQEAQVQWVLSQ